VELMKWSSFNARHFASSGAGAMGLGNTPNHGMKGLAQAPLAAAHMLPISGMAAGFPLPLPVMGVR
jgi:hypothetical protein